MQPSLSQHLFQQLDDAVREVFELMLNRPCIPAPCCLATAPGLTALVRFSGALSGDCTLYLDLSSAGNIAEQLTGESPQPGSSLPADTVGELCNMIAGSWKSRLEPALAACQLSIPTIYSDATATSTPGAITRTYRFHPHCFTLQLTLV